MFERSIGMVKYSCRVCGALLTAEGRLLNAIFGEEANLCTKCIVEKNSPKCTVCGASTNLSMNGEPRCKIHMGAG